MKTVDGITNVMIAGAGTLGLRIALRCALDGYQVKMFDISDKQLAIAHDTQTYLVKGLLKKGAVTEAQVEQVNTNLVATSNLQEAIHDVDLVSESVIENIELKKEFYADLTPRLNDGVIVTTNTSYLLPSQLLESIKEPALFCALHFHDVFNQIVVDVMPHPGTDRQVVDLLMEFGRRINQIPVYVQKENSGYMFNAMLIAIIGQASELFANEVGSFQDIDRSFMGNFGTPAGPFGMLDQVGLDTAWHIINARTDRRSVRFAKILKTYIDRGKLGFKSGEGFYSYPAPEYSQVNFLQP